MRGEGGGAGGGGAAPADELAAEMERFGRADSYTTIELLKESGIERTELVRDAAGRRFVRKYIDMAGGPCARAGAGAAAARAGAGTGIASTGTGAEADAKAAAGARAIAETAPSHPYEQLPSISCPYLPRVEFAGRIADKLVVVSEYAPGTNLRAMVEDGGPLGPARAHAVLSCVCAALEALHGARPAPIVHRDVNPGNIIVDANSAVLIDLGIARFSREGAAIDTQLLGTSGYAAPETYGFRQSDARSDVYSLGMTMRFMLTDKEPGEQLEEPGALGSGLSAVFGKATRMDPANRYGSVREMWDELGPALEALSAACAAGAYGAAACPADFVPVSAVAAGGMANTATTEGMADAAHTGGAHAGVVQAGTAQADAVQAGTGLSGNGKAKDGKPRPAPGLATCANAKAGEGGDSRTEGMQRNLWRIWQVLVLGMAALFNVAMIQMCVENPQPNAIAFDVGASLLLFTIPAICLANVGDVLGRIPLFSKAHHPRLIRAGVCLVVCFAAAVVFSTVFAALGLTPANRS